MAQLQLSASAITAYKTCPTWHRLAYRHGLRPLEKSEAIKRGSHWAKMHEIYQKALISGMDEEEAKDAVIAHINEKYSIVPLSKTQTEWNVERLVLIFSFIAYLWYWEKDPIAPVAAEFPFYLPLHNPETGKAIPTDEVVRLGKIDMLGFWHSLLRNIEQKSTTKQIDHESKYWDKLPKDTQISMYALAIEDMKEGADFFDKLGIPYQQVTGNTLYDVWHVPSGGPIKVNQGNTKAFIESGEYFNCKFDVEYDEEGPSVTVDGVAADIEVGKKGFSMIETPEMFANRLLKDMTDRPEYYFQRREVTRSPEELLHFRQELFNIYQSMKATEELQCYYENEHSCKNPYPCDYFNICYGEGADSVCKSGEVPPDFRCIFNERGER